MAEEITGHQAQHWSVCNSEVSVETNRGENTWIQSNRIDRATMRAELFSTGPIAGLSVTEGCNLCLAGQE